MDNNRASDQNGYKQSARNTRILWVTYINIVLYAVCYQLQRPVEPFLVKELSKTSENVVTAYGSLQSFFSAIQTVGSPLVGILLDRIGIQKASAIIFLSSALSYALLSQATTMQMLFWSKVPTALQHAFLVAQAVAATSCQGNEASRAQALGRMTTAYTIGATLGPSIGGFLAEHGDFYLGAKLAVVGSLLSVVLSLAFLPDVVSKKEAPKYENGGGNEAKSKSFWDDLQNSATMAMRPWLWPLLTVKVVSGVASSMFLTIFPIVLTQEPLNLDPAQLGLNMSAMGLANAAFGAVGVSLLTKQLNGAMGLSQLALILRPCFTFLLLSVLYHISQTMNENPLPLIIAASVLHGVSTHALATGLTTQTTGAVSPKEQGALLGLEHGLFSMARIGGPSIGTAIFMAFGFSRVALSCGIMDGLLLALLLTTSSQIASGQKPKGR